MSPEPRALRPDEAGGAVDLLNRVFWLDEGNPPELLDLFPAWYPPRHWDHHRVLEVGGRLVSHVGIIGQQVRCGEVTVDVAAISGVCTLKGYRKRGYASACLSDAIRIMEQYGYDLSILWTGIPEYYRRWGYEYAGRTVDYRAPEAVLRRIESPELTVERYEARPGQLEELFALYETQRYRLVRTADNMARALTAIRRWAWLARRGARAEAYAVVGSPWGAPRLQIYAGPPRVAAAALAAAVAHVPAETISLSLPPGDPLGALLQSEGVPAKAGAQGMIKLLQPGRLLQKFGLDPAQLPPLPPRDQVVAVLGSPDVKPKPPFPLDFFLWPLDHV